MPGTMGDALRAIENLPGRGARAVQLGPAHRARRQADRFARLPRRRRGAAALSLRRLHVGVPDAAHRSRRLFPRQLRRALRARHRRRHRRRSARAQARSHPRARSRPTSSTPAASSKGRSAKAASRWRRGAATSTRSSGASMCPGCNSRRRRFITIIRGYSNIRSAAGNSARWCRARTINWSCRSRGRRTPIRRSARSARTSGITSCSCAGRAASGTGRSGCRTRRGCRDRAAARAHARTSTSSPSAPTRASRRAGRRADGCAFCSAPIRNMETSDIAADIPPPPQEGQIPGPLSSTPSVHEHEKLERGQPRRLRRGGLEADDAHHDDARVALRLFLGAGARRRSIRG